MKKVVLYCKSYRDDVLRARKLAQSVERFNRDKLDFYVSAPSTDLPLFREHLQGIPHLLLDDDEVLRANPRIDRQRVAALRGYVSSQIVKNEFWRLGLCENYLTLDSDSYFIRDFGESDFITPGGYPYTVMHEGKEFLQYLTNIGKHRHVRAWTDEQARYRTFFPGVESRYRFGPTPTIWSGLVWAALDEHMLKPRGLTIVDAIENMLWELQLYGGALLTWPQFPLLPREPLFKLYGYIEEYWRARRTGETDATLAANYLGVTRQSNWDKVDDFEPRKRVRRAARKFLKYAFGRW
jgi:hypothetical protein